MRVIVTGGCGFIGSHVVRHLLTQGGIEALHVVDNLCSGSLAHLREAQDDPRVRVHQVDLKDADKLIGVFDRGFDHVFHFAANPDIAKAASEPPIDFWEGTYLTQNVLEAMRITGATRLTYASGSGVYGDRSHAMPGEAFGPLEPVSTYGASKLGCEALIAAYCHMFGFSAAAFRFANVVGDGQTHGVTYDFVRRLRTDPTQLEILGDGTQDKAYVHVDDIVQAMFTATPEPGSGFSVFNVGTDDTITVKRIAELTIEEMGLDDVHVVTGTDSRGWRGDVPVVRLDYGKIKSAGWRARMTSEEAIRSSIRSNIAEAEQNTD